jgi:hypothetical protein
MDLLWEQRKAALAGSFVAPHSSLCGGFSMSAYRKNQIISGMS